MASARISEFLRNENGAIASQRTAMRATRRVQTLTTPPWDTPSRERGVRQISIGRGVPRVHRFGGCPRRCTHCASSLCGFDLCHKYILYLYLYSTTIFRTGLMFREAETFTKAYFWALRVQDLDPVLVKAG
jgi:hypothetical protein